MLPRADAFKVCFQQMEWQQVRPDVRQKVQ